MFYKPGFLLGAGGERVSSKSPHLVHACFFHSFHSVLFGCRKWLCLGSVKENLGVGEMREYYVAHLQTKYFPGIQISMPLQTTWMNEFTLQDDLWTGSIVFVVVDHCFQLFVSCLEGWLISEKMGYILINPSQKHGRARFPVVFFSCMCSKVPLQIVVYKKRDVLWNCTKYRY